MNNKLELLRLHFADTYKACQGKNADWQLFLNMVNNLKDAIEEMDKLNPKNPIIKVAFNEKYNEIFEEIQALEKSLKERKMI